MDFKAYNPAEIEPKWQKKWEEAHAFEAEDFSAKPKYYNLVEFPYPSGHGMHVGHIKAYSGLEVVSRKRRKHINFVFYHPTISPFSVTVNILYQI